MPTLLEYYGISIVMNMKEKEHEPPHIHAKYSGYQMIVDIKTLSVIGSFPITQQQRVIEWVRNNQRLLLEIWDSQEFEKLKDGMNIR